MSVSRETIYLALLAKIEAGAGTLIRTYTRRWKSVWDDPGQRVAVLPMLVQWEQFETYSWTNRGIGSIKVWDVTLEVYAKIPDGRTLGVKDDTTSGSAVLNPLIDAIDDALAGEGQEGTQTLGGLVKDVRIEGTITKVFGDEDPTGQCGALIPVRILVNP